MSLAPFYIYDLTPDRKIIRSARVRWIPVKDIPNLTNALMARKERTRA